MHATPGYLPGPIDRGGWHVIPGLYKIPEAGCAFALAIDLLEDTPAATWWLQLLASAHRLTPVGGSDCHDPADRASPLGTPTTWIRADAATRRPILDGLASGRVVLTAGPSLPPPLVEINGGSVRWEIAASTTARRLVLRSVNAIVGESHLHARAGDVGRLPLDQDPYAAPVAAELRGPSDALLALVPMLGNGG